jgi:hypothetical protein
MATMVQGVSRSETDLSRQAYQILHFAFTVPLSRKLLTHRSLQTCQGSGVGSIPIGRSIAHPAGRSALRISLLSFPQPCEFRVIFASKYR